jgi:CheY-like chemotaxis protein
MKRIYVTEDSPTQALRVKRILSELPDTQVTFFNDGLETYLAVVDNPPDLLLLDLILPTLHGLAICRLLKFHDDHKKIPIAIFSSVTESDLATQAASVGADGFLRKPFTAEELLQEVWRLLGMPA